MILLKRKSTPPCIFYPSPYNLVQQSPPDIFTQESDGIKVIAGCRGAVLLLPGSAFFWDQAFFSELKFEKKRQTAEPFSGTFQSRSFFFLFLKNIKSRSVIHIIHFVCGGGNTKVKT